MTSTSFFEGTQCLESASGVHMWDDEITDDNDDEDNIYKPTICRHCHQLCFFDWERYCWVTNPYTIEEEPI